MPVWLIDALYNAIVVPTIRLLLLVGTYFHPKLKRRAQIAASTDPLPNHCYWFHASSMGEFEQLSPIIREIHSFRPDVPIVVSLWSPSGYTRAKSHAQVHRVILLPADSHANMVNLVRELNPLCLVVDRYDLWRNMTVAASAQKVPIVVVNATFPGYATIRLLHAWIADTYSRCTTIFAVTNAHAQRFQQLLPRDGITVKFLPDTRIDEVVARVAQNRSSAHPLFRSDLFTIVAGSTWPTDVRLLHAAFELLRLELPEVAQRLRLIIVPHEPSQQAVTSIRKLFHARTPAECSSDYRGHIVVDTVGHLVTLYGIANAAWVGGGFEAGVHSTTEPVVYGLEVACGPKIDKSADAQAYEDLGVLTRIARKEELVDWLKTVIQRTQPAPATNRALSYIHSALGSSRVIAQYVVDSGNCAVE